MEWASDHALPVLEILLPGFVAAWVFYSCTPHTKGSPFERVVQALIFLAFVRPLIALVRESLYLAGRLWSWGTWTPEVAAGWSVIVAVIFGLLVAKGSNSDFFCKYLRRFGVTKRTSHPSEWYSAFAAEERWVTLHLKSGRRIHGFPSQYPDTPPAGHFILLCAEWLDGHDRILLSATQKILIPADDVYYVEIMKEPHECQEPPKDQGPNKEGHDEPGPVDEGQKRDKDSGALGGKHCPAAGVAPAPIDFTAGATNGQPSVSSS